MLNLRGVKNVRKIQKIAVEETRLGIPLIIGFDVIHGYETLSPIPLAESASWDLEAIKNLQKSLQKKRQQQESTGPLRLWLIFHAMRAGVVLWKVLEKIHT